MDLTPYVNQLRTDLLTAASVGSDETRRAAALLAGALEPAARLAMMNALSDLTAEITTQLRGTSVDLRLDGGQVRLTVQRHSQPDTDRPDGTASRFSFGKPPTPATTAADEHTQSAASSGTASPEDLRRAVQDAGGELSRTTVRLFNELKTQAERAAADQGLSLNTYISRAVADSVRTAVPHKGGSHHPDGGAEPGGESDGPGARRTVTGFVQA